jgi:peptidoglycan/xylan/chitin deacetylase (PgdA/CDA1 family)
MKLTNEKIKQYLISLLIILLVVLVFALIDFLIINLRSNPGDDKEEVMRSDQTNSLDTSAMTEELDLVKIKPGEKVFIPILNFHHIDKAPAGVSAITKTYYIEPVKFESILVDMIASGYKTVFVSEIVELLEQGIKPPADIMAISFDDGNQNFYTNAWPILQKHGLKSAVYIMTGVGGDNYLNDEQIKELAQTGLVEFGSHTIYHPKLTKISKPERLYELEQSKEELENLLNQEITVLAYPYGLYNDEVKALAMAIGYKAGLTFDQDAWQDPTDLLELKRISVYPNLNVVKFLEKLKTVE